MKRHVDRMKVAVVEAMAGRAARGAFFFGCVALMVLVLSGAPYQWWW